MNPEAQFSQAFARNLIKVKNVNFFANSQKSTNQKGAKQVQKGCKIEQKNKRAKPFLK